jgi:protein SCO1
MERIRRAPATTTIILVLCCLSFPCLGPEAAVSSGPKGEQSTARAGEQVKAGAVKQVIPDLVILDQDGKKALFYSQMLKGKVVAINFIYTTCTAFCASQGAIFSRLQALLGDKLGSSVHLITITTDPEADTPERLKTWSVKFGAKAGWSLVTGEKGAVDEILKALTGDVGRKGMHSPVVLIGDVDQGLWIRDYGLAEPERLAATIEQMITGKQ